MDSVSVSSYSIWKKKLPEYSRFKVNVALSLKLVLEGSKISK